MRKVNAALKMFAVLMVVCLSACQHLPTLELETATEYFEGGRLKSRYTYYLDADGNQVLHGERETWSEHGRSATIEEYQDGKLVRSFRMSRYAP
jgi:hypothetical protein